MNFNSNIQQVKNLPTINSDELMVHKEQISFDKFLKSARSLSHGDCGKSATGDFIPNIISINRYYEYNTTIYNLNSSWSDFFTGVHKCVITIEKALAE